MGNPLNIKTESITKPGNSKWWLFSIVLLIVVAGIGIGFAAKETGALALLTVPLIVLFIGAIIQPDLGLILFVMVTYIQLSNVAIVFHGLPSLAQPMAGLLMVIILIRAFSHGEIPQNFGRSTVILTLYVLALYISMLFAGNSDIAITTFTDRAKDILGGVLVFLLIQRPSSFRHAIWGLIFSGIIMGSISVYQYMTGSFNNTFWGFGGWQSDFTGGVSRERLTGPYANPNAYAQVLVSIVPLALDRLWHERKLHLKLIAGWAVAVTVLSVIFSFSRGGFVALLIALGVLVALRRPRFFPLLISAGLLIGLFQLVPASYQDRIATLLQLTPNRNRLLTDISFRGRTSENLAAVQMFLDNPITGVGIGNFEIKYQDYARKIGIDFRSVQRSAASLYLEVLAEQGLVGSITFILLMFYIVKSIFSARKYFLENGRIDEGDLTTALIASVAGYMTSAIVKNSAYSNAFWILMGIALSASHLSKFQFKNHKAQSGLK